MLAEHIQSDSQFNYAAFSVSSSTLIYQSGAVGGGTQLIWSDRSGKQTVLSEEANIVQSVALSPKEDRLALSLGLTSGQLTDIWTFDLDKNKKARLTFDQHSFFPVWSPDGRRLAFDRVDSDGDTLIVKDVLGSGTEEILLKLRNREVNGRSSATPRVYSLIWTPDGKYLIYLTGEIDLTNPGEIDAVEVGGQHKRVTLVRGPLVWSSIGLSPDGSWLAYSSNESGASEVYVIPFRISHDGAPSTSSSKWQVSNGGGVQPVWRGDGKEMFITNSSVDKLMSVRVRATADHFESDKPQILFDLNAHPVTNFYHVTRDGQKIYMTTYGRSSSYPINVTTNWMRLVGK